MNPEYGELSVCCAANMKLYILPLVLMRINIIFFHLKINNQPWLSKGSLFQLTLLFPMVGNIAIDFHYVEECLFYDN